MKKIRSFLNHCQILTEFRDGFVGDRTCHLVGGAVRDALLNRHAYDFDFVTPDDPSSLARNWASYCQGHWFWLDETRQQSRVTFHRDTRHLIFDFAPYRALTLTEDLFERDFTVNAIALEISTDEPCLFDPCGGVDDLGRKILRVCSPDSFIQDPLRILRAARFAAILNLNLDEDTIALAQSASDQLANVAPERIKTELFHIFSSSEPAIGLRAMETIAAVTTIFGPGISAESMGKGITQVISLHERLNGLSLNESDLDQEVESGLSREGLLLMAAFLQQALTPEQAASFSGSLVFSKNTQRRLTSLLSLDQTALEDFSHVADHNRSLALWAESLGHNPIDALLWHIGKAREERLILRLERAMTCWKTLETSGKISPLLNGHQIGNLVDCQHGKFIGQLLSGLKKAEIEGRVQNPEEAQNYIKCLAQKEIDKG